MRARLQALVAQIADLDPSYFALAMATGIVALATHLVGVDALAWGFFRVDEGVYALLWLLLLARLTAFFPRVVADLSAHARAPGFFTVVAATAVLGDALATLAGAPEAAFALWLGAAGLWVLLVYAVLAAVVVAEPKPTLEAGLNGTWLLLTVATESVAVLGTRLAPRSGSWEDPMLFVALVTYLLGAFFYVLVIALVFDRFAFVRLAPEALGPAYWINMGAAAITTLAGAQLIAVGGRAGFLARGLPFLRAFTLLFWAVATWWVPLLLVLGAWRHVHRRVPLAYEPGYWGLVFPLGMYTACTVEVARAEDLPFLLPVAHVAMWAAVAAWALTAIGLLRAVARTIVAAPSAYRR